MMLYTVELWFTLYIQYVLNTFPAGVSNSTSLLIYLVCCRSKQMQWKQIQIMENIQVTNNLMENIKKT